jgi:hypothetical protein
MQNQIRSDVVQLLQSNNLTVFCQAVFCSWPSSRETTGLAADFVAVVAAAVPELQQTGSAAPVRRYPVRAVQSYVPERLARCFDALDELRAMPGMRPGQVLLAWVDSTQTFTPGPEYERFVVEVLLPKRDQLKAAPLARVVVAGRAPFFPDFLHRALQDHASEIPPHWGGVSGCVLGVPAVSVWP